MKGILFAVIIFLCAIVFLIFKMKDQSGEMEKVVQTVKEQQIQDKAVGRQIAQNNTSTKALSTTFAGHPIPPSKVNSKRYTHFFEEAVMREGRIFRWKKPNLTYYIDLMASRRLSKSKVRRAFNFWARKTKNLFTFREVANPKQADIFIQVKTASEKSRMGEAGPDISYRGQTFNIDGQSIPEYVVHHAQVTIAADHFDIKSTSRYTKAGTDHGFQTLVHELGHVLGLMGHSPTKGDCMYYRADPTATACDVLTPEVNTLAMIYGKRGTLTRGFYQQRRTR